MNIKQTTSQPFIRPAENTDRAELDFIFRITADATLRSSPDPKTLEYASHVWCHPYPFLYPECSFVAAIPEREDGTLVHAGEDSSSSPISQTASRAVGYILSTPSTEDYCTRYQTEYLPSLPASIQKPLPPDTDISWRPDNLPNALLHKVQNMHLLLAEIERDVPGVLDRYPAHLHVDVLPEWQGRGLGTMLMERCLGNLRKRGVKGLHLQMVEGNTGARAFYKAVGFRQWSERVGGKGEWCMVIDL